MVSPPNEWSKKTKRRPFARICASVTVARRPRDSKLDFPLALGERWGLLLTRYDAN